MNAQGSLEYMIIIAVVLAVSAIVIMYTTGIVGGQKSSVSISSCKQAAIDCKLSQMSSPNDPCLACGTSCVNSATNQELFNNAVGCCKAGKFESIYADSTECSDLKSELCVPLIENGPSSEKVDIIFIPDDYMTDEELSSIDILSFKTRATKFIDYNAEGYGLFSKEPFKSNKNLFNVYLLNIKEDKNCQIPDENGGDQGGCMLWAKEKAELCGSFDTVVVLSNDLSGTGGQSGYAFTALDFAQVTPFIHDKEIALGNPEIYINPAVKTFIHEFGHSFGGLKDEYSTLKIYDDPAQYPNCDSFGCPKWCSGSPVLPEPQYTECSKITDETECKNAALTPSCQWIQIYGNYVCMGTNSNLNFGVDCLDGYGCYQGCEGLNDYRSMFGCNILGGICTGNEDLNILEFSPRAIYVLEQKLKSLSGF